MIRSLKYLSLFLWIAGAGLVYGLYVSFGLPHVIWSYTFRDNGDPYNPYAERHYISCTFAGPNGVFKTPARNGRCGWVKFFRVTDQ